MKHIKLIATAVIAASLIGCASTAPRERTEYPTLTVLSQTPYVWDDSKSVALNVATMALPAGVGKGMQDYATKEEATNGQSTAAGRAFGNVVMGLSQGVFGVLSDMTQTSQVDKALAWSPAIVEYVPVDEVGDDLGPQGFLKLRNIVSSRVYNSLMTADPTVESFSVRTPKNINSTSNIFMAFKSSFCEKAQRFQAFYPDKAPAFRTEDLSHLFMENIPMPAEYCILGLKTSIAGTSVVDGKEHYIVVSEIFGGAGLYDVLSPYHEGYFLMPNSFKVSRTDAVSSITKTFPFAFVAHKGNLKTFVKP